MFTRSLALRSISFTYCCLFYAAVLYVPSHISITHCTESMRHITYYNIIGSIDSFVWHLQILMKCSNMLASLYTSAYLDNIWSYYSNISNDLYPIYLSINDISLYLTQAHSHSIHSMQRMKWGANGAQSIKLNSIFLVVVALLFQSESWWNNNATEMHNMI